MRAVIEISNVSLDVAGMPSGKFANGSTWNGTLAVPDGAESCSVHMALESTALGTGVIGIKWGNFASGEYLALASPLDVGPGADYAGPFSVVGYGYLHFPVTTIEAGEYCKLSVCFTGAHK